jgi:hypothetical protein
MARRTVAALAAAVALAAAAALGAPSEEQIARLGGPNLTPVGAERAGNAEGTIPEWTGGVTEPPPGWKPGMKRPDPFADDEILFSIDASNVDQYADKLTPGQVALIKSYDGYTMNVYPSRRSCAFPEEDYENIKRNARTASVDEQCFLTGGMWTVLFPFPEDGCQAVQNGRVGGFGALTGYDRMEATLIPTKSGSFVPVRRRQVLYFRTHDTKFGSFDDLEGVWAKSLSQNVSPPKQAGEITLVHSLNDGHLKAWTYNPGQRRVRRNPNFEYDNPIPGFQGLMTVDATNGFIGAADRYNWKLLGKRELYIPYNNFKFFDTDLEYNDMVEPRYPRRDLIRYELHRVWVVEGAVRPDRRHTQARRVLYLDEDNWFFAVVDGYDTRGELWRVSEHLPQVLYEVPTCVNNGGLYYDLVAGRYVITPAFNEEKDPIYEYLGSETRSISDDMGLFKPDDLRRMGRR